MTQNVEQLLIAVLDLPETDRLELIEAVIVSFQAADQPPFDDSWREVIQRRSAELASDLAKPVAWEEVRRRAWESIGG